MGTIPGSTTTITPENAENMINWIIKPMINDSILKRKLWQPEQDIYLYVRLILDKYNALKISALAHVAYAVNNIASRTIRYCTIAPRQLRR